MGLRKLFSRKAGAATTSPSTTSHVAAIVDNTPQAPAPEPGTASVPTTSRSDGRDKTPQLEELPSYSLRLWNTAYNDLEAAKDGSALVKAYRNTLADRLAAMEIERDPARADHHEEVQKRILEELCDDKQRQKHLTYFVEEGKKEVERSSKAIKWTGAFASTVLSAKPVMDIVLQVPQAAPAALPWAGVCLGMEILANPDKSLQANLDGIEYVCERMEWYNALCNFISEDLSDAVVLTSPQKKEMEHALENRLVDLYKAILLYQMRSVCMYYKQQGLVFLQNLGVSNEWYAHRQSVIDAEEEWERASAQYHRAEARKESQRLLLAITTQSKMQERIHIEDQDRAYLKHLFVLNPEDDKERIEEENGPLLEDVCSWVLDEDQYTSFACSKSAGHDPTQSRLLWIKGPAGRGKTMLVMSIIRDLSARFKHSSRHLGFCPSLAYFFCDYKSDETSRSVVAILRSLIWMLLRQQPNLIQHLRDERDLFDNLFNDDVRAWTTAKRIFKSMIADSNFRQSYLVVDALDECDKDKDKFLELVSFSLRNCPKMSWLISSRQEIDVVTKLKEYGYDDSNDRNVLDLGSMNMEQSVNKFVEHKISTLKSREGYDEHRLKVVSDHIRGNHENTFLWVALVFRVLDGKDQDELSPLNGVDAVEFVRTMPPGLTELYGRIMDRIEKKLGRDPERCKAVLAAVALSRRSPSFSELAIAAGLQDDSIARISARKCGSFLVTGSEGVHLLHKSAKDYLLQEGLNKDRRLGITESLAHFDITERSLDAMRQLYQDGRSSRYHRPFLKEELSRLSYSLSYWQHHFDTAIQNSAKTQDQDVRTINDHCKITFGFLKKHFIHWFECVNVTNEAAEAVRSLKMVQSTVQSLANVDLDFAKFLTDAVKFMIANRDLVESSPNQLYGAALAFESASSEIGKLFWEQRMPFIKTVWTSHDPGVSTLRRLRCDDEVHTFALSRDGTTLASVTEGGRIQIWDVETATPLFTLRNIVEDSPPISGEDHGYQTNRNPDFVLAFSADGTMLAIGSEGGFLAVDTLESRSRQTLSPALNRVSAIALSADCRTLAAGGWKQNCEDLPVIALWDLESGKPKFVSHDVDVRSLMFLGDRTLASYSSSSLRLWDGKTGHFQDQLVTIGDCRCFALSHDNETLAWAENGYSADYHFSINTWNNALSNPPPRTIGALNRRLAAQIFSPDDRTIALISGGWNGTMLGMWNATTGLQESSFEVPTPLQEFRDCYAAYIRGSSRVVIASIKDRSHTVEIQTVETDMTDTAQKKPSVRPRAITCLCFSSDGQTLASRSFDGSIQLWAVKTNGLMKRLKGHTDMVMSGAFSPDGKFLVSGSQDRTVRIWGLGPEEGMSRVLSHDGKIESVAISADGSIMAAGDDKGTICLWDMADHRDPVGLQKWTGPAAWIRPMIFSHDCKYLASTTGHYDERQTVYIWNMAGKLEREIRFKARRIGDPKFFSFDDSRLEYQHASVDFKEAESAILTPPPEHALHFQEGWVRRGRRKLLYLPEEHYPTWGDGKNCRESGHTVAIANDSGGVTVVEFDFEAAGSDYVYDVESEEEYKKRGSRYKWKILDDDTK